MQWKKLNHSKNLFYFRQKFHHWKMTHLCLHPKQLLHLLHRQRLLQRLRLLRPPLQRLLRHQRQQRQKRPLLPQWLQFPLLRQLPLVMTVDRKRSVVQSRHRLHQSQDSLLVHQV